LTIEATQADVGQWGSEARRFDVVDHVTAREQLVAVVAPTGARDER
jgi:hypothetical protein